MTNIEESAQEQTDGGAALGIEAAVGQVIRELRNERGWTQQQLAEAVAARGHDMSRAKVTKTESALRPLWFGEIEAFATALGVDMVEMLQLAEVKVLATKSLAEIQAALQGATEKVRKSIETLERDRRDLARIQALYDERLKAHHGER